MLSIDHSLTVLRAALPLQLTFIQEEAWQTLKAAVSEQTAHNRQSAPCFCKVGERFRLGKQYRYCPSCGKVL